MLGTIATIMGVTMSLGHMAQAYKIFKTKSSKSVSLLAYPVFSLGSIIWLMYGVSIKDFPIMLSYTPGALGATLVVILIFIYKDK